MVNLTTTCFSCKIYQTCLKRGLLLLKNTLALSYHPLQPCFISCRHRIRLLPRIKHRDGFKKYSNERSLQDTPRSLQDKASINQLPPSPNNNLKSVTFMSATWRTLTGSPSVDFPVSASLAVLMTLDKLSTFSAVRLSKSGRTARCP